MNAMFFNGMRSARLQSRGNMERKRVSSSVDQDNIPRLSLSHNNGPHCHCRIAMASSPTDSCIVVEIHGDSFSHCSLSFFPILFRSLMAVPLDLGCTFLNSLRIHAYDEDRLELMYRCLPLDVPPPMHMNPSMPLTSLIT